VLKLFPCLLTLLLMMTPQFALCESAKERFMEVLRSGVKDPELAEATLDYIDGVMSRRIKEEHSLPKETLGSLEKTIAKYLNSLREDNRSLTFSEDLKARIELRHLIYQVEFDGKQPIDQLWEAYEKLQYFEKQVCYLYLLKAYVAAADQLHQEREWTPENLGNALKNQGFAIEPAEYPVSKKLFQMMAVTQEALDGDSISPPLRNAFEDLLYEWDRKVEIERKQMEQSLLENYFNKALLNKSMEWREWQNAYRYWRGNTPFVVAKEVPETVYKETFTNGKYYLPHLIPSSNLTGKVTTSSILITMPNGNIFNDRLELNSLLPGMLRRPVKCSRPMGIITRKSSS